MEASRKSYSPTTTLASAGLPHPFSFSDTEALIAALKGWLSDKAGHPTSTTSCSSLSSTHATAGHEFLRCLSSPTPDVATPADQVKFGVSTSSHAPAQDLVIPYSSHASCRRSPELRSSGPAQLPPPAPDAPEYPISAVPSSTVRPNRFAQLPQVSSADLRRSLHRKDTGPAGEAPPAVGDPTGTISAMSCSAVSSSLLSPPLQASAPTRRRSAHPLPAEPPPFISSTTGDPPRPFTDSHIPLVDDRHPHPSHSSSGDLRLSSADEGACSAADPPPPAPTTTSGSFLAHSASPSSDLPLQQWPGVQRLTGQQQSLTGQHLSLTGQTMLAGQSQNHGQPEDSGQISINPLNFVTHQLPSNPKSSVAAVLTDAITASTTSMPTGTSFRTALLNKQTKSGFSDPFDAAPIPARKGEIMTIPISDKIYAARLHMFDTALIGRLILRPGDKPWNFNDLRLKLQSIWNPFDGWKMTSLGKGFYSFKFGSIAERDRIRASMIPSLKPGILKLFQWTPRFNPNDQKTSLAQVWVRFSDLSEEYYDHSVIWGLARCVGTPLKIDPRSLEGSYAHFARVLVEVDLSREVETQVGVEHSNGLSIVSSVSYERLPEYCHTCQAIGHSYGTCRKLQYNKSTVNQAPAPPHSVCDASQKQVWHVIAKKKAAKPSTVSVSSSLNHILSNLSAPSQVEVPQSTASLTAPVSNEHVPNKNSSSLNDLNAPPKDLFHRSSNLLQPTTVVTTGKPNWADMAEDPSSEDDSSVDEDILVENNMGTPIPNTDELTCVAAKADMDPTILTQSGSQFARDPNTIIISTVSPILVSAQPPATQSSTQGDMTRMKHQSQLPSSKNKRRSKRLNKN